MPILSEQIDAMTPAECVQSMELLWARLAETCEDEMPEWHARLLAVRKARADAGAERFIGIQESKRRLRAAVHAR